MEEVVAISVGDVGALPIAQCSRLSPLPMAAVALLLWVFHRDALGTL